MAMIISLNIDAGSSRLRSRSLICFISLKERSTVAVDTGSTMAMVSRILMLGKVTHFASLLRKSVASSFNDKLFSSKMTHLKAFHSCLVSSYRHLLQLRRRFHHTQSQLSTHKILGASPILQCHICAVAGHPVGHFCGSKMLKAVRGPRYL